MTNETTASQPKVYICPDNECQWEWEQQDARAAPPLCGCCAKQMVIKAAGQADSQTKSFGDDAQLYGSAMKAARQWARAEHQNAKNLGAGGPGKEADVDRAEEAFRTALDAMFDSRAPAAQASATIQAAPDLPRLPEPEEVDNVRWAYSADQMRAYGEDCRAATIQEPVMVAEPGLRHSAAARKHAERVDSMHKGVVGVFAAIKAEHLAAPMVADPAGVANKQLLENIEELPLAATVKAVPSEALQLAFSREDWGIIFDGVMLEIDRSQKRKESNAASNSDKRVEQGKSILAAIRNVCAAPLADKTGGGE